MVKLNANDLKKAFLKQPSVLLITAEGGAGKTSLACQIAQWGLEQKLRDHRMLPVLIETEFNDLPGLEKAIRGKIESFANQPIDSELFLALLRRQRILVIVDHLSEMTESSRQQIRPDRPDFPAKALVVTSRLNESLDKVPKTVLSPQRIESDRLFGFMNAYAKQKGRSFEDEEYATACSHLRRMVGQRSLTVLLAKLYADQMIEQQQGAGGTLPDNVPDLMLSYINRLNREVPNPCADPQVQRDAQIVAWQCLQQTYRPTTASKAVVLQALAENSPDSDPTPQTAANERLDYLEKRLQLLKTLEPGDKLRIVLDPLAEYLAALWLVDDYGKQDAPEEVWRQFLDSIETLLARTNDSPATIQGFLLAVRDCCQVKQTEARIPDFVPEELARKAGLNPEELRERDNIRRIRLLIADLSAPEEKYRVQAAEDLAQYSAAAKIAQPNLIGMLRNRNQTLMARQAAAKTLGKLGLGAEALIEVLTDNNSNEDPAKLLWV